MPNAFCFSVVVRNGRQPRMKPFRSTAFFTNGVSSRPPVTEQGRAATAAAKEFFPARRLRGVNNIRRHTAAAAHKPLLIPTTLRFFRSRSPARLLRAAVNVMRSSVQCVTA